MPYLIGMNTFTAISKKYAAGERYQASKTAGPKCTNCGRKAERTAANQGYSDCCNDRIEGR